MGVASTLVSMPRLTALLGALETISIKLVRYRCIQNEMFPDPRCHIDKVTPYKRPVASIRPRSFLILVPHPV